MFSVVVVLVQGLAAGPLQDALPITILGVPYLITALAVTPERMQVRAPDVRGACGVTLRMHDVRGVWGDPAHASVPTDIVLVQARACARTRTG